MVSPRLRRQAVVVMRSEVAVSEWPVRIVGRANHIPKNDLA